MERSTPLWSTPILLMITTRYYYGLLNEQDKKIYKAIYDGIMNYAEYVEVPGSKLDDNKVGGLYHCVLWDNPFIFSVGEYAMWHAVSENKQQIKMTTLCDTYTEAVYRKRIEDVVNQILSDKRLQKMNDFQKEVFVHDFIINNIKYDKTLGDGGAKIQPYTTYGALVEHKAVCEGIAKTVKLLLNMLDVQCIVVSGSFDGHGHAWNIVKLDKWAYHLDVTMDLGLVIHPGKMRYNYFNFRDGDVSSYKMDNAHLMPKCEAIKNNYVIRAAGYVSNYDRLLLYIEKSIKKRKTCLYFKINRNVNEQYSSISFIDFQKEVKKAYGQVTRKLGINTEAFIDVSGPGEMISLELDYH